MEDYPRTLEEFEARFAEDATCREYLVALRWPEGLVCPQCQSKPIWSTKRGLLACGTCGYQGSVTAGTIFHGSRKPLKMWFRAIWRVTSQKTGASALGSAARVGLGQLQDRLDVAAQAEARHGQARSRTALRASRG